MTESAPDYLAEKVKKPREVSQRITRNSQKLNIPLLKTATRQRTYYYRTVSLWATV